MTRAAWVKLDEMRGQHPTIVKPSSVLPRRRLQAIKNFHHR